MAALAQIPWEIARPKPDAQTLGERNLVLRAVHDTAAPPSQPLELAPGEELRVLFVFAESRDSTPLGMREERRALQRLFEKEIYPERRTSTAEETLPHRPRRARTASRRSSTA